MDRIADSLARRISHFTRRALLAFGCTALVARTLRPSLAYRRYGVPTCDRDIHPAA